MHDALDAPVHPRWPLDTATASAAGIGGAKGARA
jgi:hypothetical protein